MSGQAHIDAPGALHHIIVRGIERKRIFQDDQGLRVSATELARRLGMTKPAVSISVKRGENQRKGIDALGQVDIYGFMGVPSGLWPSYRDDE
jgi:hypothetical protein